MDAKAHVGFRVSPATAAVVIEALRLYARERGIQGHKMAYAIDRWDKTGDSIEERVAETSSLAVAKAAFRMRRPVIRKGW